MAQQYDDTNRGVLFKNDRKDSANHPDYKGSIDINGEQFWLSAWIKSGKNGNFMSLAVTPKDERSAPRKFDSRDSRDDRPRGERPSRGNGDYDDRDRRPAPRRDDPLDDDIPF